MNNISPDQTQDAWNNGAFAQVAEEWWRGKVLHRRESGGCDRRSAPGLHGTEEPQLVKQSIIGNDHTDYAFFNEMIISLLPSDYRVITE
jgi:hypothetical protein